MCWRNTSFQQMSMKNSISGCKQIRISDLKSTVCITSYSHKTIHALHVYNIVKSKMEEVRKTFLYHKNMLEWDLSIELI